MKVAFFLALFSLTGNNVLADNADYDKILSDLKKASEGIEGRNNQLFQKLDTLRETKSKLHEHKADLRKDEQDMRREKGLLLRKSKELEQEVDTLKFMKENEAG